MEKKKSIFDKIIVILGPTASGKSELAIKIAKKYGGEIISADSRQVYKWLDIGSGKVPLNFCYCDTRRGRTKCHKKLLCYKNIPHHLLDVASPKKTFTVSQYQKLAKKAIQDIIKRGKIPVVCGGAGLYIDALLYDYNFPQVPPQPKLRKKLEKITTEGLFKKLQKLDPRRAKNIDRHNRRRLARALEIVLTAKKPVPELKKTPSYDFLKIGVKKSPEELKKLIKKRLLARLRGENNMIKETENLHYKQNLSWQRLDDLGLEYRYISRYLRGLIDKKEMVKTLEKEIYRYAKRQMTWFKRDQEIVWVKNYKEADNNFQKFMLLL